MLTGTAAWPVARVPPAKAVRIQVRWPQGPAAAMAAGQQLELRDLPVN